MNTPDQNDTGAIIVQVTASGGANRPIRGALVTVYKDYESEKKSKQSKGPRLHDARTDQQGRCVFEKVPPGCYLVGCESFTTLQPEPVTVDSGCTATVCCRDPIEMSITTKKTQGDCNLQICERAIVGSTLHLIAVLSQGKKVGWDRIAGLSWSTTANASLAPASGDKQEMLLTPNKAGLIRVALTVESLPISGFGGDVAARVSIDEEIPAENPPLQSVSGDIKTTTTLTRTETSFTEDTAFWTGIRNSTDALSFNNYLSFMDWIFCGKQKPGGQSNFENLRFDAKKETWQNTLLKNRFLPFTDSDAYRVVKAATEAFVMVNCGVLQNDLQPFDPDRDNAYLDRRDLPVPQDGLGAVFNKNYLVGVEGNGNVLPYLAIIRRKLPDIPIKTRPFEDASLTGDAEECFGLLQEKLENPCLLELIWSYWHEEGMLVQSVAAITRRFQNIRSYSTMDPLSNLEMDPLRPLNNLFWGYIQDEQHRLTVGRRNYEYDHHYGLRLEGKAVQNFRPADTRSKFLEAFHHLLRLCTVFYKQDDDTTIKADAFPVLNALKEVHLILSQGAHNQFGDLPSTARIEMLMQEWLLARPEFREFLPTRIMVAYPEPWMDRVDAMKKLQGWTDTSVLHFRNLGMFGEQLLLSIRWGHWSDEFEPVKALNWARFFRPQAQGYIHAYRAATGVDLSADPTVNSRVDSTLPSVLLQKRLAGQRRAS